MKTASEIGCFIANKGKMVQDFFYPVYHQLVDYYLDELDYLDKYVLTLICYNVTREVIKYIYDNQSYYSNIIYLSKRGLERARKDIEQMPRIEYPDEYDVDKILFFEQYIIDVYTIHD